MDKSKRRILFIGKNDDTYCESAITYIRERFEEITVCLGEWGDPIPKEVLNWEGDYIISYLSRWVLPEYILERANIAAINFHPASPDYPGIGCNNFALYEGANFYGVTCHHMVKKVATGQIIAVKKFAIQDLDDVLSILERTYKYQLNLFYQVVKTMYLEEEMPISNETWTRLPFSRKELKDLATITQDMSEEEIKKRIRATSYGNWKPTVRIGDFIFEYKEEI